jgi:hypothetical protein
MRLLRNLLTTCLPRLLCTCLGDFDSLLEPTIQFLLLRTLIRDLLTNKRKLVMLLALVLLT